MTQYHDKFHGKKTLASLSLLALSVACGQLSNEGQVLSLRSPFSQSQFYELPLTPSKASVAHFDSLLSRSGALKRGIALRDTTLRVGDSDKTCTIKKGEAVALVAAVQTERGEKLLVAQPLSASQCAEDLNLALAEGYLNAQDIKLTNDTFSKSPGGEWIPGTDPNGEGIPGSDPRNPNGEGLPGDPRNPNGEDLPPGGFCKDVVQIERERNGTDSCDNECGIPGESFRAGGGDLALLVTIQGSADTLHIGIDEDSWFFKDSMDSGNQNRTMGVKTVAVDPAKTELLVEYRDIIDNPNSWKSTGVKFHITASRNGQTLEGSCDFKVRLMSPIVLDLSTSQKFTTVEPVNSTAHFDLNADGIAEKTGWVTSESAFLAMDLNGNGIIDNGQELFGDSTLLPGGKPARNGYEALAQYASGAPSIDARNPNFGKLVAWIDHNGNGKSEKGELKSLSDLGITRIGVTYSDVPKDLRQQQLFGNVIQYQAKFWGPAHCGTEGCNSYDVYFATSQLSYARGQ